MMRYAFINAENIVVNVIVGDLNDEQKPRFFSVQQAIFGATQMIEVADDEGVWIGGTYTDGRFAAPELPEPEPQSQIVDGISEMIEEPVAMLGESQPEPLPEPEPEI